MNAVPFDTLKLAQDLEAAGLAASVAAGAAAALADALSGADLATKSDLERLEAATKSDLERLETRIMGALALLRRDMTIKLGSMMFVAVGILLAAMRFMPHP